MFLNQRPGVSGVGFHVQYPVGMGIKHRVVADLFKRGQAYHCKVAVALWVDLLLRDCLSRCRVSYAIQSIFPSLGFPGIQIPYIDIGVYHAIDLAGPVDSGGVDLQPICRGILAYQCRAAYIRDLCNFFATR